MTHAAKQLLSLGVAPQVIVRLEATAEERGLSLRQFVQALLAKEAAESREPPLSAVTFSAA